MFMSHIYRSMGGLVPESIKLSISYSLRCLWSLLGSYYYYYHYTALSCH